GIGLLRSWRRPASAAPAEAAGGGGTRPPGARHSPSARAGVGSLDVSPSARDSSLPRARVGRAGAGAGAPASSRAARMGAAGSGRILGARTAAALHARDDLRRVGLVDLSRRAFDGDPHLPQQLEKGLRLDLQILGKLEYPHVFLLTSTRVSTRSTSLFHHVLL